MNFVLGHYRIGCLTCSNVELSVNGDKVEVWNGRIIDKISHAQAYALAMEQATRIISTTCEATVAFIDELKIPETDPKDLPEKPKPKPGMTLYEDLIPRPIP